MEGDAITLVDKESKLLANIVQILRFTTLLPGMEEWRKSVGLVENGIWGDTGVEAAVILCQPGQVDTYWCNVLMSLLNHSG